MARNVCKVRVGDIFYSKRTKRSMKILWVDTSGTDRVWVKFLDCKSKTEAYCALLNFLGRTYR